MGSPRASCRCGSLRALPPRSYPLPTTAVSAVGALGWQPIGSPPLRQGSCGAAAQRWPLSQGLHLLRPAAVTPRSSSGEASRSSAGGRPERGPISSPGVGAPRSSLLPAALLAPFPGPSAGGLWQAPVYLQQPGPFAQPPEGRSSPRASGASASAAPRSSGSLAGVDLSSRLHRSWQPPTNAVPRGGQVILRFALGCASGG